MGRDLTGLRDQRLLARVDRLCLASDCVWLAAVTIAVGSTALAASLHDFEEPTSGKYWAYAGLMLRGGLYLWARDGLRGRGGETIFRLLELGMVAGMLELLIDWGLIHWVRNGQLVYSGNDVVLLGSPIWMPLAWACVIVDMGYAMLRGFGLLRQHMSWRAAAVLGSLLVGASAGILVGFYENFAYWAGWWEYRPAHFMISAHCPLYIPLGEALMFFFLLPVAARTLDADEEQPIAGTLIGGLCFAAVIAAGYALSYFLLEFGRTPSA
jgi:hypothetical protein